MKTKNVTCYLAVLLCYCCFSFNLSAQDAKTGYFQRNNYADFALGAGKNIYTGSLSLTHFHQLGNKKKRFGIGYGLRLTSAFGNHLTYVTAPARLTSEQTGPQVIFSKTYYENIDTFKVSTTQMNALNLSINLQYNISPKFTVGANIDAAGLTFGKGVSGKYISASSSENNTSKTATPNPWNLLLVSDNDYGTLNSEFYVKYKFSEKWGLRAGYEFTFTEYKTKEKLRLDNDRFRAKHQMFFVAIAWHLIKK